MNKDKLEELEKMIINTFGKHEDNDTEPEDNDHEEPNYELDEETEKKFIGKDEDFGGTVNLHK